MLRTDILPEDLYQRRKEFGLKNAVKMLIELIETDKKEIRKRSIKYLGLIGSNSGEIKKECFNALENILISDDSVDIKCEAARALGKTSNEKALKPLKWILKQKSIDNEIRLSALRAISNIKFENDEIKLFIKELASKYHPIRESIKNHLILLEPEKLIKNLIESLSDEKFSLHHKIEIIKLIGYELASINVSFDDISYITINFPEILSNLIQAKSILVEIITENLREDDPKLMENVVTILQVLGIEVNSELLAKLEHDDFIVKKNAITLIGKLKIKEAVQSLIESLDDMYNEISQASIEALGEIGDLSTIPALLKALDIEDVEFEYIDLDMKWFILDSVKKICLRNEKYSFDYLLSTLESDNDVLKESIAYIMGEIGKEEYTQPLLGLLEERNFDVKKNAIIGLGKIGTRDALAPLIAILDNERTYWLVKKVAIDAVYNIYIKNWMGRNSNLSRGTRHLSQNTEKLIDYLNRSEKECFKVRLGVIKFLEKFGGKTALAALIRRVNDFHRLVRISASNAIKRIEERLELETQ